MAISANIVASIKNAFVASNGIVKDMHNNGIRGDIQLAGLVVCKNLEGEVVHVAGHLIGKAHCVNRVTLSEGKVALTPDSLSAGMYREQATSAEAVVEFLNSNEKHMAEVVYKRQQNLFWSVL